MGNKILKKKRGKMKKDKICDNKLDNIGESINESIDESINESINESIDVIEDKYETLSKTLYKILKYDRSKLPTFLEKNGSYSTLIICLKKVEEYEENRTKYNIIQELMLGYEGLEHHKQKAIYELPTMELISIITRLCNHLNITKIEEVMAGQGLLSKILEMCTNLEIKTTDGFRWIETFGKPYYTNIEQKLLLQYTFNNISYDDTLILISWIGQNCIRDFKKFLEIKKPKQFIMIGEYNCPDLKDIINHTETLDYYNIYISAKQICYKDYFKYNRVFDQNMSRSSVIIFLKNSIDNILTDRQSILTVFGKENLNSQPGPYTDKLYIQDMIVGKLYPIWSLDLLNNNNALKDFIKNYSKCIRGNYSIPNFINNYEEFCFWFSKKENNKYPLLIRTHNKFLEYKNLIEQLNIPNLSSNNGLTQLKEKHILPNWINNRYTAEKFIWLEFSTKNKIWKESNTLFRREFNRQYLGRFETL